MSKKNKNYVKPEKNKKAKKKNSSFLSELKSILHLCVNNQGVLDARKRPFWYALLLVVFGIIFSLIPSGVNALKVKGGAVIAEKNTTYSVETGLREFSKDLKEHELSLEIKDNTGKEGPTKILALSSLEKWNQTYTETLFDYHYYSYKHFDGENEFTRLRVFYVDGNLAKATELQQKLLAMTYSPVEDEDDTNDTPIASFLILGKENAYMSVYDKSAQKGKDTKYGNSYNYVAMESGLKIEDFTPTTLGLKEQKEESLKNWTTFFDNGYKNIKVASFWLQTGLYAGTDVLVVFFVGLMIFIVTRGKKNPFRSQYTFFESIKAGCIASLAPGILTLVIGFIFPQYASMIFMVMISMRVVWMTSKNLSPYVPSETKK